MACRIASGIFLALFLFAHISVPLVQSQQLSRQNIQDRSRHLANPPSLARSSNDRNQYFINQLEDKDEFMRILNPILRVRVPDTPGNKAVRAFIINEMQSLSWTVEEDKFKAETPNENSSFLSPKPPKIREFSNVIATLNPDAPRRLILACHYDSKLSPKGFLGATDSAVPCAQMIHLAHVMDLELKKNNQNDLTLQFVFFDGEEPFVEWRGTDNTYGARHLAKRWEDDGLLNGIDALVLLDLLGAKDPSIRSLDTKTDKWHQHLRQIETMVMRRDRSLPSARIFSSARATGFTGIEDDHIPFFRRKVPVLHLIAAPFPDVWHTLGDDRSAIDWPTVWKLNRIFRVFVAQYMGL